MRFSTWLQQIADKRSGQPHTNSTGSQAIESKWIMGLDLARWPSFIATT